MPVLLTTDLSDPSAIPYFMWDDPMTVGELRARLANVCHEERMLLIGRIMREARDADVWQFTTVDEVTQHWPEIARNLGRRRPFWAWLLGEWRAADGVDA